MTKQQIQKQIDNLTYSNNIRISQQDINEANQKHAIAVATNQIAIAKNQLDDFSKQRKIDDNIFDEKLLELQNELYNSAE